MRGRPFASLGPEYEAFVRESGTPLLRAAVLLVGDRATAEDLVQITLIRTGTRWASARQAPRAYARRVLVNLAKDSWRTRARRPETPFDTSTLPEHAGAPEDDPLLARDELVRALDELTTRERAVLVLRYFEDLPVADVAQILDCAEGTVRSLTHRGLARLRDVLLTEAHPIDAEGSHAR